MTFVTASSETSNAGVLGVLRGVDLGFSGEASGGGILTHSTIPLPVPTLLTASGETSSTNGTLILTKILELLSAGITAGAKDLTPHKLTTMVSSGITTSGTLGLSWYKSVTVISGTETSNAVTPIHAKKYLLESSKESSHANGKYNAPFKRYYGEFHITLPGTIHIDMTGAF